MTKASELVVRALRSAGIVGLGQQPSGDDISEAFDLLNEMIATWAKRRWLIYRLVDLAKIATGAQTYTVGPGGDFEISQRPDQIEKAYFRQFPAQPVQVNPTSTITLGPSPFAWQTSEAGSLTITGGSGVSIEYSNTDGDSAFVSASSPVAMVANDLVLITYSTAPTVVFTPTTPRYEQAPVPGNAVDYPITLLTSREDYSQITLKGLETFTYLLFYDPKYPLGELYPYPVPPSTQYELHILVKAVLSEFPNLASEIELPPEYIPALRLNLASRLKVHYQMPPDAELNKLAEGALATIRSVNTAVSTLSMPSALDRRSGTYNIFSDQNT